MVDPNETCREAWLARVLGALPAGARLLDAGAGELRNRRHCGHLEYVSQDFCQYGGSEVGAPSAGLQNSRWDTSRIDLVSDITAIPAPDSSFDAVLCSEVLEHVPEPGRALDEFARLLRPGGVLILTAPFASLVHMAPYHYCSGFSSYWYEHHLPARGFAIRELTANGDWYAFLRQELTRLGGLERSRRNWTWPLAYAYALLGLLYFRLRSDIRATDLACFGWHCVAVKGEALAAADPQAAAAR
ncbi:MAG: class I SAM-dependent methyltransferase [Pseudomonadota bacterium]|jgi:SAM-dependent methyltransferase